jgi:hypothetical protein
MSSTEVRRGLSDLQKLLKDALIIWGNRFLLRQSKYRP